jgi:hypothetical protein
MTTRETCFLIRLGLINMDLLRYHQVNHTYSQGKLLYADKKNPASQLMHWNYAAHTGLAIAAMFYGFAFANLLYSDEINAAFLLPASITFAGMCMWFFFNHCNPLAILLTELNELIRTYLPGDSGGYRIRYYLNRPFEALQVMVRDVLFQLNAQLRREESKLESDAIMRKILAGRFENAHRVFSALSLCDPDIERYRLDNKTPRTPGGVHLVNE